MRSTVRTRRTTPRLLVALAAAGALALVPSSAVAYPNPGAVTGDVTFVHDPTMINTGDGYLLYSTNENVAARTSTDRTQFDRAGSAFTSTPSWWDEYTTGDRPWAPDISQHNGKYLLYYAVSVFGSNTSAIGLATSSSGRPGTWDDQGVVYTSQSGDNYNAIDPNLFVDDDGTWWLSFGSWWSGIKMIEIDPATGKQASWNGDRHSLADRGGSGIEAPHVVKRNGSYYLFVSFGKCCEGTDSTYNVRVGRADNPAGPYYDQNGVSMLSGGGTVVLESHGRYIGPGGQSVMPDSDGDLLVYHYYDGEENGVPKLGVNLIDWSSGWPVLY